MQAGGGCLVGNVLEAEVALGVVVADVGYHLSDEGHLAFGQQSGLHIAANHAAEAAAEVKTRAAIRLIHSGLWTPIKATFSRRL